MSVITVKRVIKRTRQQTSRLRRSFGESARHYLAHESRWHFALEALLFAILLAISAWPILAAVDAVNQFLQRTTNWGQSLIQNLHNRNPVTSPRFATARERR